MPKIAGSSDEGQTQRIRSHHRAGYHHVASLIEHSCETSFSVWSDSTPKGSQKSTSKEFALVLPPLTALRFAKTACRARPSHHPQISASQPNASISPMSNLTAQHMLPSSCGSGTRATSSSHAVRLASAHQRRPLNFSAPECRQTTTGTDTGYSSYCYDGALLAESKLIGTVSLMKGAPPDGYTVPDIGYAILPNESGNGYATEATLGLLDYARRELGVSEVVGFCGKDDIRSRRVLEKIEMDFRGERRLMVFWRERECRVCDGWNECRSEAVWNR